jgi:hypothetical protein
MLAKLSAILIAFVLVFGGAAATASAAQQSLPTDALYPVKTLSESVALGLSVNSAAKLEKALGHAQRRVDEMAALARLGMAVPKQTAEDYAGRVEFALRLAARMTDDPMSAALAKIQLSLQTQLSAVEQLAAARPDDLQLAGVEWQLRQHLGLVLLGLSEPQMFREQLAAVLQGAAAPSITQDPSVTEEPSVTVTPDPGDDNSNDDNANGNDSNTNDANGNDANSNDANANDSNTNDDDANTNDDGGNANDDDSNTNEDDSNTNDDDANGNGDDDSNGNDDDDINGNDDDDINGNGDDDSNGNGDDDSNGNGDDDSNGNGDDDSNGNGDDDSNGNSDDDSNGNSDDDSNGNGDDDDKSGSSISLNSILTLVARMGGFPLSN